MNKILMAGGGTLGSVSPLLAIKEGFEDADYLFITTTNGVEREFLKSKGVRVVSIPSGKLRRYFDWQNFLDIFNFFFGFLRAIIIISRYKPDIILTSGSFVAVPVAIAGKLLNKKVFLHQQDIELGLANKVMAKFADVITVNFKDLAKYFPPKKVVYTGNPVRHFEDKDLDEDIILVLGGSQGARGLNDYVNELIPEWSRHTKVVHILGQGNYNQRLSLENNYEVHRFVKDEIGELFQRAKVVITRGGISTLTELAHFKKACIIVGLPESHQLANAKFFANKEAAIALEQNDISALKRTVDELLSKPHLREKLGNNLSQLFNPQATEDYIKLVKSHMALNIKSKSEVFIAGIGGIGSSALAQYFLAQNYKVTGSEISPNEVTQKLESLGVKVFKEHSKDNLPKDLKLFIHSSALPSNHEEILEAKRRQIPVYNYNEYLGIIAKDKNTVAISGTNGKTTTTGLAGFVATEAGADPTVIVGGLIPQLSQSVGNYRSGKSNNFIVEACEFRSHMLNIPPKVIILTNIEEDHMDYYRDLKHIQTQFQKFVDMLPEDGLLIRNADDPNMQYLETEVKQITYGIANDADYQAKNISENAGIPKFDLYVHGKKEAHLELKIHGTFNILNTLAVIAMADHLKLDRSRVLKAVSEYNGSWRRFERLGEFMNVPVYSDYGHHPTAIEAVIKAARNFYPNKNIYLVFQPHTYNRTESMLDKFTEALKQADKVIISKTYEVAGRTEAEPEIDPAKTIAGDIPQAIYATSFGDIEGRLVENISQEDVLLFMGAGDIDLLARKLTSNDKYR